MSDERKTDSQTSFETSEYDEIDARDEKRERQGLKNYSVIFASIIVVLAGVHGARGVLGMFFLATFFTVLLISPVNWLKSKGIASWLSLTFVIMGVAGIGLCSISVIGAQLAQFAGNIDSYRYQFNQKLKAYNLDLEEVFPLLKAPESERRESNEEGTSAKEVESAYLDELRAGVELGRSRVDALGRYRDYSKRPKATFDLKPSDVDASVEPSREEAQELESAQPRPIARRSSDVASIRSASLLTLRTEADAQRRDLSLPDASNNGMASAWNDENPREGLVPDNPPTFFQDEPSPLSEEQTSALGGSLVPAPELDGLEARDLASDYEELGKHSDSAYEDYERRRTETTAVDASSQQIFSFLKGLAGEVSALLSNAFLITLLLIFMLFETAKIPGKLVAALGRRRFTNSHIEGVISDIRNYMVIKTMMSSAVGALVIVLCFAAHVQYPFLWGFVAFFLNYIPNIGSVAAAVPPIILATIDRGVGVGIIVAIGLLLINCIIGYVVEPRLLGDGLDLSPLIVLIALVFFGWLLGPVGMFLSPPLAVIMKIIFQSFPETRWIAALMANRAPPPIDEEEESAA